jgi:hypothetical protein
MGEGEREKHAQMPNHCSRILKKLAHSASDTGALSRRGSDGKRVDFIWIWAARYASSPCSSQSLSLFTDASLPHIGDSNGKPENQTTGSGACHGLGVVGGGIRPGMREGTAKDTPSVGMSDGELELGMESR